MGQLVFCKSNDQHVENCKRYDASLTSTLLCLRIAAIWWKTMGETNGDQESSLNSGSDEELGKGLIEPDQPDSEFSGIEITYSMKVGWNKETIHRL